MKQTVKIISDSTCDLSRELEEKYGIDIIPLHVLLGDHIYFVCFDISTYEIYSWVDENRAAPKTSAPVPDEMVSVFQKWLAEYPQLVVFSIASGMSSCNADMHLAAQELEAEDRIHIIDSANLSTGIGLLVLEAAEMAQAGADAEEIVAHVEKQKPLVRASFVVDTLMYLYRGGRCSGVSAFAGQTLKLHPMIYVADGEMGVGKKYRGNIDRVTLNYAADLEKELLAAQTKRVFVTHSGCSPETIRKVCEYVSGLNHFEEICLTRAGSVVTSHCGPGTLGVLFIAAQQ